MTMFKPVAAVAVLMALSCVPSHGADSQTLPTRTASQSAAGVDSIPGRDKGALRGYRIGAGDVLQIVVWKEPDASVPSVVVRADGKISVPLIKDVEVLGMTPAEAETMLASKLSQFIHGADVTVVPKELQPIVIEVEAEILEGFLRDTELLLQWTDLRDQFGCACLFLRQLRHKFFLGPALQIGDGLEGL